MTNWTQSLIATSPVSQHNGTQLTFTPRSQMTARAAFCTK